MSAERVAEQIAEAIDAVCGDLEAGFTVDEDLRSGGFVFEVRDGDVTYEVLVAVSR